MTSHYIDFDRLLTPISAEQPSGQFLRYEGTYDAIREARKRDDGLDQGAWATERRVPDWDEVIRVCLDALYQRTKDIRIAASLVEALIHRHGLAGLTEGLAAVHQLSEGFWDTVHPGGPAGEALEDRVAVFDWMNQRLPVEVKLIPITAPTGADHRPQTLADYERLVFESDARREPRGKTKAPPPALAKFQASEALTPVRYLSEQAAAAEAALQACDALGTFLDDTLGRDAPGLLSLRQAILSLLHWTEQALAGRQPEIRSPEAEALSAAETPAEPLRDPIDRIIRNRWEAYRMLRQAADFLAQAEPHSPVPYLVRRAVAWGDMTLEELLVEVVRNDSERKDIFRLLQIPDGRS